MKGKDSIRKGMSVLFIVIQSIFLILALLILILSITVYAKLRTYLQLTYRPLVVSCAIALLYLTLFVVGILSVMHKRKTCTYAYIMLVIVLMNIDMMLISREYDMVMGARAYTDRAWDRLSVAQRMHVQGKLACCGFDSRDDRRAGECDGVGCRDVFMGIVEGVKHKSERFITGAYLLKSLSLALICMAGLLSGKKKRKRSRSRSRNVSKVSVKK